MKVDQYIAAIAICIALLPAALPAQESSPAAGPQGAAREAVVVAPVRALDDELRDAQRAIRQAVGFKARQQALLEARRVIMATSERIEGADPETFEQSDALEYSFAAHALEMIPEAGFVRGDCDDIKLEIRVGFDPQRRGIPEPVLTVVKLLDAVCGAAVP
jgi:hypothetical protein